MNILFFNIHQSVFALSQLIRKLSWICLYIFYIDLIFLYWFYLFFTVPPNIIDTESTQSTVAVRENQNISLTCKADGFPTPKIMWRREDGQAISVERRKKGNISKSYIYIIITYNIIHFLIHKFYK